MAQVMHDLANSFPGAKLLLVFGSVAKGTETTSSDLDIAVLMDHELSADEKLELIESVGLQTGRAVDLVDLRSVGQPLLNQIVQANTRILGTDEEYARLLMRNVCDNEDFVPMLRRLLRERRHRWIEKS